MRLSEAIDLGSAILRPQRFGYGQPHAGTGCALQMAAAAVGSYTANNYMDFCRHRWPWLSRWNIISIVFRFDMLKHSATRIADYVRTIEPAEPTEQPQPEINSGDTAMGRDSQPVNLVTTERHK